MLRKAAAFTAVDEVESCMRLAALSRKAGLNEEALALYEKVVQIAPESRDARRASRQIARLKRRLRRGERRTVEEEWRCAGRK